MQRCRSKTALEQRHNDLVGRLSTTVYTMADLAGKKQSAAFLNLQHECQELRTDIKAVKEKITAHRRKHHC